MLHPTHNDRFATRLLLFMEQDSSSSFEQRLFDAALRSEWPILISASGAGYVLIPISSYRTLFSGPGAHIEGDSHVK